jgi:hypothetical protein
MAQEIGVTFEPDPRGKLARLIGREPVLKRENSMTRTLIIGTALATALLSSSVFTQERSHDTASVPDFSGIWGNPYLYGIEPALSGPGPVVNKSRQRQVLDVDGRPYSLRTPRS